MSEVSTRYVYFFEGEYLDEDDMPETFIQDKLVDYIKEVLRWYCRFKKYKISGNVNVYREGNWDERVAPDVMVIKNAGITEKQFDKLKSYAIAPPKHPAPASVIEIVSESSRPIDLVVEKKPTRYGELGVKEYFAFDPDDRKDIVKLCGWRYIDGLRTDIKLDKRGWLWSEELDCWLGADDIHLRFYDNNGQMLLTQTEADFRQQRAEWEIEHKARLEAEKRAVAERQARAEIERWAEAEKAEAEKRAEAEKAEAERQLQMERQTREEAEKRAEAERLAREEAEKQAETARQAKEEAEKRAEAEKAEAERIIAELRAKLEGQQPS
jgi:Uma2 family endonuclease